MMTKAIPALALALAGCASLPADPPALAPVTQPAGPATGALAAREIRAPVTILVSIDGFRPDYIDRGVAPTLARLAAAGVTAPMRPSFPTKTFPNHWAIVTGAVPDRNGIVGNRFEDPRRPGETFTMMADDPFWWNEAEPIWVTAERAGVRTATMFWPGANVGWGGTRAPAWPHRVTGGTRPSDWQQYGEALTGAQRVAAVIDWLRRPAATRPRFVTLYFDTLDTAGHEFGPNDPRTLAEATAVDATVADLVAQLAAMGQPANLVIVSDHGMTAVASDRTIALDRLLPAADAKLVETGPYAAIAPAPGRDAAVAAALLRRHDHMACWRREAIPPRFRYGRNPRVAPFLCLAEDGWEIKAAAPATPTSGGAHGYDNDHPNMRALFVANGPAFAAGKRLGTIDNVEVAPLLRRVLRLPAGDGLDGDDGLARAATR